MSSNPLSDPAVRERIMADPESLLCDGDILRALVGAGGGDPGGNVIDLRGVVMRRLEARLTRLEDTHRTVVATACENLAGTAMVHRAVLALLDAATLEDFLHDLAGPVATILRVDSLCLILEGDRPEGAPGRIDRACVLAPKGFADLYAGAGPAPRQVTLRACAGAARVVHGEAACALRSEACLRLEPGAGRPAAMLAMGSRDPERFAPNQGQDLLGFFADAAGRALGRLLR